MGPAVDRTFREGYLYGLNLPDFPSPIQMPNIKSAKKRMELSRRAREKNRARRSRLKTAVRLVETAEDVETAQERFREASSLLDRAAGRRLVHPNKAARTKSRLAEHVKALGGEV